MIDMPIDAKMIKKNAINLLKELYDITKGDEWDPQDLTKFMDNSNLELKQNLKDNTQLMDNVLQSLLAEGFIEFNPITKHQISITYEGKKYLDRVPHFETKITDEGKEYQ